MKCTMTKMMEATQLAWSRENMRVAVVSSEFDLCISASSFSSAVAVKPAKMHSSMSPSCHAGRLVSARRGRNAGNADWNVFWGVHAPR